MITDDDVLKLKQQFKFDYIKNSVKLWTTELDGFDGAIGGIMENLPYPFSFKLNKNFNDFNEQFNSSIDEAIGARRDFDKLKLINGDVEEVNTLDAWADNRTFDIKKAYDACCELYRVIKNNYEN